MSDDKTKPAVSDEMVEKALRAYYSDGPYFEPAKNAMREALEAAISLAPAGSRFGWASKEELVVLRDWFSWMPMSASSKVEPIRQRLHNWLQEEIDSRSRGYRGPGIYRYVRSGNVWEVIGRDPKVETIYMRTHPSKSDLIFQEDYQAFDENYVYLRPAGGEGG